MKAGLLCFAALAAAQPNLHRRHHHHRRDVVTDVVTEVAWATAAADVVVYVDAYGNPLSTGYEGQPEPTAQTSSYAAVAPVSTQSASYSAAPAPSSSQPAPWVSSLQSWSIPTTLIPTTLLPVPSSSYSSSSAASSSHPSQTASPGADSGYGLAYSPYRTNGGCKSQDDVNADFQTIFASGSYSIIRLYGTDCDQVAKVLKATESKGTSCKIFAGIFDISNVEKEAAIIVNSVNGDWSRIDTVSVGNELINDGKASVSQVKSAVNTARGCLTGYSGHVVTVDTFVAFYSHPDLCEVGDYVAANCHAFFDGGVTADGAGKFVLEQAQKVSSTCGGKNTVITESGWPSKGTSNKVAVPSPQNQQVAIASLKSSFSSNLFLFTAFNDYWKQSNSAQFGAEPYWGILGNSASCMP